MRIGITVDMRHSMFSAGHPNSCIAVCEAMQVGGHEVFLVTKDLEKEWWDDVLEMKDDYNIIEAEHCIDIDIMIEVAFHLTPLQRRSLAKKTVWYCRKPALFTDIESTVFACRIEGRNLEGVSEIWVSDLFNKSDDIEYLKTLYPSLYVSHVPWLWSPTIVEAHRKEKQSPVWPQVLEQLGKDVPWSLHIMETNASNTSSCTLPLLMSKNAKVNQIQIHNTEILVNSTFFKDNIVNNCAFTVEPKFVGRQRTIDWSHEPKSIIVSHTRFIPLKMANLEAAWVGIPILHNNMALKELGCGLEDFYYEGNNIMDASKSLEDVIGDKVRGKYTDTLDTLTELRKRILYRFSPEAHAQAWLSMLDRKEENIIEEKIVEEKKTYTVLFTDMWTDFNAEYNMFLLAIQDYLKDYEVVGTSVKGGHNMHIFGPFGTEWLEIKGPKVHFTGENTGPIEHPLVKLNIGFKNFTSEKYLRMPLWMFEIDWFNANLNKIQNPLPLPLEACTKTYIDELDYKKKFCAFVVSNPKNSIRNAAFHTLNNEYKPVDSAGRLFNNIGEDIFAGLGGGGGELKKHEFLKGYKFCLCYENESSDGYVTEKLLHAKAAGCVPIYWGASDVGKDFDPNGFLHIKDPSELLVKVKEVDEDDEKWRQIMSVPALTKGKVVEVRDLFKKMAQTIVENSETILVTAATLKFLPYLKKWIENVEIHRQTLKDLRAIVFVGSDISDGELNSLKRDFIHIERFPVECPVDFPDFWNPQHFAWKLWALKRISHDVSLRGSTVFYMDCASVIIRWPSDWINQVKTHKISFLDDTRNINRHWCHKEFCEALNVSEEELNSSQIAACLIMFKAGDKFVMDFFSEALKLGSIRKIIAGEKWSGFAPDGKPFGHRHDQSILSILGNRNDIHRIPIDQIYNHTSARATFFGGQYVYVHRGDYKEHVPLVEGIDDAYVVNLDRRSDRLKSFVEHHPYFKGKVRRHKAVDGRALSLTPNLVNLLDPNDFFWKKAVAGCMLSHLKLWTMLFYDTKEIGSYLIMEDDARLQSDWQQAWSKIQAKIPEDWECVYLGGVLPPNKEGFKQVLEDIGIPGLCRIAPNTFFGQSVPSRQFHFCTYAYVLSKRGAKKLLETIEQHRGIWTSADHVLFNSLDKEHVFVLNPLVAGASQDDDPAYVNSDFNNFSRIDKFDSDLWNNDERFSQEEISSLRCNIPLDILKTVNEVYNAKTIPKHRFVSLDICKLKNEGIYEGPWLEELMQINKFEIEVVSKETDLIPYENLVVLVIRDKWEEQIGWLTRLKLQGKKFKVLHFSDEFEQDPCFFYSWPEITGILRFYPRKDIDNGKVLSIPLGYHWKNNLAKVPSIEERPLLWSFYGTNWNGRSEQLKPLMALEPNKVEFYNDWKHPSQLGKKEFIELLLNSKFVPCPRGNNIETFRLYEVLECGCIPVFTELPVSLENSGIPFRRTDTWEDVVSLIDEMSKNPLEMAKYHMAVMQGWKSYKTHLKQGVIRWLSLA
jgi:GR25 family glycosyltransferase involved in LPS biosynthesis